MSARLRVVKMRLAVLGATGPSGQCVVQQALEAGYQVVALVRSPEKIQTQHDNLQVLKTDIFSEESLIKGMENCDAVMSCLGGRPTCCGTVTLYSHSIVTITNAMRACRITRLIAMTSAYTRPSEGESCLVACCLRGIFLRTVLADMAIMEDYLQEECTDLTWTAIKPPGLQDKPLDPRGAALFEGQFVPGSPNGFPRSNVAKVMLEQLTNVSWHNKMVAIAFPPAH